MLTVPVQTASATANAQKSAATRPLKVDLSPARVRTAIVKYQSDKGTGAIPPFTALWEGGYLGANHNKDVMMAAYTTLVMSMLSC